MASTWSLSSGAIVLASSFARISSRAIGCCPKKCIGYTAGDAASAASMNPRSTAPMCVPLATSFLMTSSIATFRRRADRRFLAVIVCLVTGCRL